MSLLPRILGTEFNWNQEDMTKRIPARHVILDIETTGLDPTEGGRIIEIAAVELLGRRVTGKHFHRFINPERAIDPGAQAVHGITLEFLQDKPKFADVAQELIAFIRGAELVAHNAPFDITFLDSELARLGLDRAEALCSGVIDSLSIARDRRPKQRNSLDALCEEYKINVQGRNLRGALLDAYLLAEVYLALTHGLLH